MSDECPVPVKGKCWRCFKDLVGRQQKYCSEECSTEYYVNHMWTGARPRALRLAGRKCQRCGATEKFLDVGHGRTSLEVNHKVPIMGKHHSNGCWHHQENLEVLCHDCHVDETNRQFGRGKYAGQRQIT